MQLSTPAAPKPVEPKSILLIGPPGSGKTSLLMQFPKICIEDCDRNLDGPERFNRARLKDFSYAYTQITYKNGKALEVHECFDHLMDDLLVLRNEESIGTVGIDGLTLINEFIRQKIMKAQARTAMETRDWDMFKSQMLALLIGRLRGLGKMTICTCHESIIEKPDPKNIMQPIVVGYRPAVQGGITDYFGGFFTDMWRCTALAAPGGKVEFYLHTVRDAQNDLKNSIGLPSEIKCMQGESMFDKIKPYLEKAGVKL